MNTAPSIPYRSMNTAQEELGNPTQAIPHNKN
jgi:hypothetical protein